MKLVDAETLAISLMMQHGIWYSGWEFQWDKSKRRFGVCKFSKKVIGLSMHLVSLNDEERVKDTILHEIAHAIAGPDAGHGQEWKKVCIRIGAKPETCYTKEDTVTPELKYYAVCGACGKVHERQRAFKKTVKRVSCNCQTGKNWDDRVLLEYKKRY